MKNKMPDYLRLFIHREGRVVLGRKFSNVWLLTAVLTATFLAIAFANGSLNYLNFKMNDPFIKWVDIRKDNKEAEFRQLEKKLYDPLNAETYHYGGFSYDYEYSFELFGASDSASVYLRTRFFDISNSELVEAIMDRDNRICGIQRSEVQGLDVRSLGVFLTARAMERMGYDPSRAPAYVDMYQYSPGAEQYGFSGTNSRVRVPVPVLGVVKRLPGSVDMAAFTNLYVQKIMDGSSVFGMNNAEYASSLCYFIPEDVDPLDFDGRLSELVSEVAGLPFIVDDSGYDPGELHSYKNRVTELDEDGDAYHYLGFRQVFPTDSLSLQPLQCAEIDARMREAFPGKDIHRLYKYNYSAFNLPVGDYISIQFNDLNAVKPFAEELVNSCGLEVEMSQINAKENFRSVSVMAITLSVVMVIFAVVCILLFIVNLLQSYFQKVKRNIGTFKAFGISNRELERVYMTIMLALVGAALVISLLAVSLVQLLLRVCGLVKDGGFGFLSLWSCDILAFRPLISLGAIVVVVVAAALTVRLVMKKLLSATPGDLIYDR